MNTDKAHVQYVLFKPHVIMYDGSLQKSHLHQCVRLDVSQLQRQTFTVSIVIGIGKKFVSSNI